MRPDLSAVFEASPNAYMILDRDLRYVAANRAYCKAVGRDCDELIGKRLIDVFPHDPAQPDNDRSRRLVDSFRRVFETGELDVLPLIHYRINDQDHYWSATHTPLYGPDRRVEFVLQHTVDITDLQQQRLANVDAAGVLERAELMQERAAGLQDAFLQAPVAIVILRGPQFVVEVINDRVLEIWGRTREAVLHKALIEALPELAGQGIVDLLEGVRTTRKPYVGTELPVELVRDGKRDIVYFTFVYQPVIGHDGNVDAVIVVASDVTQNVIARRTVEEAQAELEAILESFPEAVFAGDASGIKRVNERARQMLGYATLDELKQPRQKLIGELVPRYPATRQPIAPDDLPYGRALRGLATRMEILLSTVDTREDRYTYASAAPVVVGGKTTGAVVTQIDITERKRAEVEVLKLARVLDATRDFVGIASLAGTPSFVNTAGLEMMGLPDLAAARALPVVEYFIEAERDRVLDEVLPTALQRGYWEGELTFKHARTGEHIPVLYSVFPLRDATSTIVGLATITRDLRAQKLADAERARLLEAEKVARTQAELANQAKDDFLATVSHELRTPLTAILGWMQMLRAGMVAPEKQERALETVERNARVQAQLIDDLLDVSRILAGKLDLELEPVEIAAVVAEAVETVRPVADDKGVKLVAAVETTSPLIGDPKRIQQVLWNLLANAVKFTPKGGTVSLHVERREDMVDFIVTDTGVGIAPEFLPHVFERFRQADDGTTRKKGGLGLGLSIVQHVTKSHGGSVRAYSDGPGKGARFVVSLPVAIASTKLRGAERTRRIDPPPALAGKHVLVVDDEADTRDYVAALLREAGLRVTLASSSAQALELVPREPLDAILSDIGMPNQDGYELVRAVRALPADRGGRTPAIALTAFARADDRTRAMRAGFQNHVAKPVDAAELFAVLLAVIAR